MAIKVQIRRGTKAQLTTYGALSAGELGYTTDEKLVYVGDGTTASNFLVGRCASGSGAPSGNLIAGTVYFDTAADITDLGSFAEVIHTHTESDISDLGSYSLSSHDHAASYSAIGHSHTIPSGTASISSATSTISSAGSGDAHNNIQPSAVVKMVIKT